MVYISSDGTVHNGPRPWDMKRIKDTFWSILSTVELFVTTLLPFPVPGGSRDRLTYRSSNGNTNSRSGSNGGSSNRPSGGFRTISDIRPPPMAFGCSGGSCGR